jgi:deoxyribose-phosphate aldolase
MQNRFSGIKSEDIGRLTKEIRIPGSHEIYRNLMGFLDLTSLNQTDSEKSVKDMVARVNNFPFLFPDLLNVAAICVFPRFVPAVKKNLEIKDVKIVSVAGSFPSSQTFIENKIDECKRVIDAGAEEIDIVISLGEFLSGNISLVGDEIRAIKESIGCTHLKVILETGVIDSPDLIYSASMLAMEAGADFIKTSTGKASVSASPEAAWVMCHAIKDYFNISRKEVGFKPAGGISTKKDALIYYSIVETVLGKTWLVPGLFRIGASRLANDLINAIEGREANYF